MSCFGEYPEMSWPPTTIEPEVADKMPPAIEQSVVLPDPDGPTRAMISSLAHLEVASSSATTSSSPIS